MKRAIALIVFAAVLLLAGCGHAKDPFVGTWRTQTNDGPIFVISKAHPGYLVVADPDDDFKGVGVLDAHGDTLTVSFGGTASPPAKTETIGLTVRPHSCLLATEEVAAGQEGPGYLAFVMMMPVTLVKVSSTTTAPIPAS